MVDPAQRKAPVIDVQTEPTVSPRWRTAAIAIAALLLLGAVIWIWLAVLEGKATDRWERLAQIEEGFEDVGRFPYAQPWLTVQASGTDIDARDRHIQKLEELLTQEGSDAAIAAHVHALVANLELTQLLTMSGIATPDALKPHYDNAKKHLEVLIAKYPSAPISQSRFSPGGKAGDPASGGYRNLASLLLARLEENREWDEKNGLRSVEPDADPLVVLRTSEGDLRLRLYASISPTLAKAFLKRACEGEFDGTYIFEKETKGVRGGDARARRTAKDKDPTPEERMKWGAPSEGDPLLPDRGRDLLLHKKGVVSAWHIGLSEELDDPLQFIVLTDEDSMLDFRFTPFAKVEGVDSLLVLERIASAKTRAQERKDKGAADVDAKFAKISTQLARPIEIVKALVYEKGELAPCVSPAHADDSEKKLSTLKLDAYRVIPPPEPAPEPKKDGAAMDPGAPMDGAPMDGPAMDGAMDGDAPAPAPAMTEAPGGAVPAGK